MNTFSLEDPDDVTPLEDEAPAPAPAMNMFPERGEVARRNRGPGRPRKLRPEEIGVPPGASAPPASVSTVSTWPTAPGELWLKILAWLDTDEGGHQSADRVKIAVRRVSGGGGTGQGQATESPVQISGDQVVGDDVTGPETALMEHVTDFYHMTMCAQGHRATYRLRFYWAGGVQGGANIRTSEAFTLDPPEKIDAQRRALQRAASDRSTPYEPGYQRQAPQGMPGDMAGLYLELGQLRAIREEAERARQENRPPREVPTTFSSAPSTGAMEMEYERKLADLKLELEKQKHMSELQLLRAEMDAKFAKLSAAPTLTAEDIARIARASVEPVAAVAKPQTIEQLLLEIRDEKKRKERIATLAKDVLELEDNTSTAIVPAVSTVKEMKVKKVPLVNWFGHPIMTPQYEEGETVGFARTAADYVAANPHMAADFASKAIEAGAKVFSTGPIGEMIAKFASGMVASGGNMAPQPQQQAATGPAKDWSGPT